MSNIEGGSNYTKNRNKSSNMDDLRNRTLVEKRNSITEQSVMIEKIQAKNREMDAKITDNVNYIQNMIKNKYNKYPDQSAI